MAVSLPEAVRAAEAKAREHLSLSEDLQMERASLGAWDRFKSLFPGPGRFVVVCGPGANGGDGSALARHAALDGWSPVVVFPGKLPEPGTLARLQLARLEALGVAPVSWSDAQGLPDSLPAVDAGFGTGLSRPLDDFWQSVAAWLSRRPTLALDLPTGLDGRTGLPLGAAVRAVATCTFGRSKPGLHLDPGRGFAGEVTLVDIGIPRRCWDERSLIRLLDDAWATNRLPPRARGAHKGAAGRALVWAGSDAYFGAAVLCCSAALRSGAGLIGLAGVESVASRIATVVPEIMGRTLDPGAPGWGSLSDRWDAVLAGPGLGRSPDVGICLDGLLASWTGPLVLDADALFLVAGHPGREAALRDRALPAVLTPHPLEAARLLGRPVSELLADPLAAALELASRWGSMVVFKTSTPVVASPSGDLSIGVAGHPGMAVGGCGDALAGAVVARLAEGEGAYEATCQAVRAHARAGDLAGARGRRGMSVTDLVAALPQAWEEMESVAANRVSKPF